MGSEGGRSHLPCWKCKKQRTRLRWQPEENMPPHLPHRDFSRITTRKLLFSCSWNALYPGRNVWRTVLRVFKSFKWSWRNWLASPSLRGLPLPMGAGNTLGQQSLEEGTGLAQLSLLVQLWSNPSPKNHMPCPTPCHMEWTSNSASDRVSRSGVRGQRSILNQTLKAAQTQSKPSHSHLWVTCVSVLVSKLKRRWEKEESYELVSWNPKH